MPVLSPYRLYLAAAFIAFVTCLALTPLVRRLARRVQLIDRPDRHRKLHGREVALGGGAAVLASFILAAGAVFALSESQQAVFQRDTRFFLHLILASLIICWVGLIDDRSALRGRQKLAGQTAAAVIVLWSGLVISRVELFGWTVDLGLLAIPFTLFWILGAINALNLIDGVDGLATSVGLVISLAIVAIAAITGHRTEAFLAAALAGSLAGFLVYNAPPASIFLGDAGSMLIGLILGTVALRGSFKGPATAALAAPAAVLAIPILDTAMAILRRKLTGRSIYTSDRGHLHHALGRRGWGSRRTVAVVGALSALTAAAAVVSVAWKDERIAVGAVAAVFGTLVVCRIFGHQECLLLLRHGKALVRSLLPWGKRQTEILEARFQGSREWRELWQTLTEFAERFDLTAIHLSITMPACSEDYHASWQRTDGAHDEQLLWTSEIPLMAGETVVGRLRISGACSNGSVCGWMGDIVAGLKPFEAQVVELLEELEGSDGQGERERRDELDEVRTAAVESTQPLSTKDPAA